MASQLAKSDIQQLEIVRGGSTSSRLTGKINFVFKGKIKPNHGP